MTQTATTQPKSVRAEFERREKEWGDAEAHASEVARSFAHALTRSRVLHDRRRQLTHREPELTDHLERPVDDKGEIAEIDRELDKLGDLAEEKARVDHARRLAESKKQACADYCSAHFEEVMRDIKPDAERDAAETQAAIEAALERAKQHLDLHQRIEGIHALADRNPRDVPGLDTASHLVRSLEVWDIKPSIPEGI